jgi:hypothetical protein
MRTEPAVATHLYKRVDGENDELGLRLGIVHEVEVDELLLLQVVRLLLIVSVKLTQSTH